MRAWFVSLLPSDGTLAHRLSAQTNWTAAIGCRSQIDHGGGLYVQKYLHFYVYNDYLHTFMHIFVNIQLLGRLGGCMSATER